jgi:hypothetical protein
LYGTSASNVAKSLKLSHYPMNPSKRTDKGAAIGIRIKIHLNPGQEFSLTLLLDRMVFCLKLSQWYTKKDDIPKLIAV